MQLAARLRIEPAVGSSRKTSSGLLTNASASASRCRWPPDSVSNGASALSTSANRSSSGCGAARRRVEAAEERERLARRDLVLQRRGLQRRADLLLDVARPPPRVDAADLDRARVRFAQPDQAFDRGRLAGAVRAEQAEDLAGVDLEAHAVDGGDCAVLLSEILDDDLWHGLRGPVRRIHHVGLGSGFIGSRVPGLFMVQGSRFVHGSRVPGSTGFRWASIAPNPEPGTGPGTWHPAPGTDPVSRSPRRQNANLTSTCRCTRGGSGRGSISGSPLTTQVVPVGQLCRSRSSPRRSASRSRRNRCTTDRGG